MLIVSNKVMVGRSMVTISKSLLSPAKLILWWAAINFQKYTANVIMLRKRFVCVLEQLIVLLIVMAVFEMAIYILHSSHKHS